MVELTSWDGYYGAIGEIRLIQSLQQPTQHLIKHNACQVVNSYMFRHGGVIIREFIRTEAHDLSTSISIKLSLYRPPQALRVPGG